MNTSTPTQNPSAHASHDATSPPGAAPIPLKDNRNFRWLMVGSVVTLMGDQFTLVALPWLALRLAADTAVLGAVLALLGVPRALLILFGGAVVDRYSPQRVLMLSKHACTLLLSLLAGLVWMGWLTVPSLLILTFGLGVASAFGIPAATSMLPGILPPEQRHSGNGLMMVTRQLSLFIGPLAAGALIGSFDGATSTTPMPRSVHTEPGLALAFALDALSFALSALTLSRVSSRPNPSSPAHPVLQAVVEGLRHCWRDAPLRDCLLYWGVAAVLISGPVHVAVPVLAASQPGLGATAFGALLGAHGLGALLGMVASGPWPRLRLRTLGWTILAVDAAVALLFMPMGHITALWHGQALMVAVGLLGGYMQVTVFSWIQQRVPPRLMGRVMSVFMFIFMGLVPVSSAVTGWLMRWVTASQVFLGAGAAMLVLVALAAIASPIRRVVDAPAARASTRSL